MQLDPERYTIDFTSINVMKEQTKTGYGVEGMRHLFNRFYFRIIDEEIQVMVHDTTQFHVKRFRPR